MKLYLKSIALILFCIPVYNASGQSMHKLLRTGDKAYLKGDYKKAEETYLAANDKKPTLNSSFNLGNSQYQQKNYPEATTSYQNALGSASTPSEKANIYHNIGNAAYDQKQYEQAVVAYKKALKFNPADIETKENLTLAKHALRQQKEQNKDQDQKNQDDKDKKDQQNQDKQNQDQQNQEKQNQDQQKDKENQEQQNKDQDQEQQKDKESKEEQKSNANELSKKEAKELLDVIENEEQKVHQKMRRVDGKNKKPKKDW